MQGVLNEDEFLPPRHDEWLMRAMGWDKFSGKNASPHSGGIWDPKEVKLRRGEQLFRIGHSHRKGVPVPDAMNLANPWWMEGGTFVDIGISADTIGIDRQRMARLKLSVAEAFGVFDTIFWVVLREPLGAFRGTGNPVCEPRCDANPNPPPAWAWPGREVMQCYIPGMRDTVGRPTRLAEQAFQVLTKQPTHAWGTLDGGIPTP